MNVDVAVVGGGPAGASTALHLLRAGAPRVVVLDKLKHPREKPCAGAVSAWGVAALNAIGIGIDVPHVVMGGLRVRAGAAEGVHASDALGVVVRRSEFDAHLLSQALARGATVRDGEGLVAMERGGVGGEGWRLTTSRGEVIHARCVAACDGSGSTVRKLLRLPEAARKGHLYVLETEPRPSDDGLARRWCDFDLRASDRGLEGYYWDFPTVIAGQAAVSRGIYHANFTPSRAVKEVLTGFLAERGFGAGEVKLKPFSTRPFTPRSPLVAAPGVVLVGEAAGIDATTGEGIAQSVLMGALAGRYFARVLRHPDSPAAERGDDYAAAVSRSRVGRHLLQSAWLARRVYGPGGAAWRAFLASSDPAREAGALWYAGTALGARRKVGLAARLAAALVA